MIEKIQQALSKALIELGLKPKLVQIDRTRQINFGDLATNAPLVHAKEAGKPPMELAQAILERLETDSDVIASVAPAPPGFLNITLADDYLRKQILTILSEGANYGKAAIGQGKRALVEFVSANPTGPLTVGHGRGAILGDIVSNILAWNGYRVDREYYYNDAGRQMRVLGESVRARYLQALGLKSDFPEDGYQGEYINEIARTLADDRGDLLKEEQKAQPFTDVAETAIFDNINGTLKAIGVVFDNYFNERDLYDSGALDAVIAALKEKGLAYEKEGATWLRAAELGREDDRVLIKGTGEPTYRLPDIAYHADKLNRGYHLLVDIFGADHQETYPDVLAGLQGLGLDTAPIKVLIHQFVTITRKGEQVKMSTRKATFVTLDELLEEVGRDVVRYFFIMRGMDTHLKFDLDLAKKQSDENPVFYLQYAHARMVNIQNRAAAFGYAVDPKKASLELLTLPEERLIMHLLWWFPEVVRMAHSSLEPQTVANYLQEFATAYHKYYTVARVVTDDKPMTAARLALTAACRQVLANGLAVLGITAPERM